MLVWIGTLVHSVEGAVVPQEDDLCVGEDLLTEPLEEAANLGVHGLKHCKEIGKGPVSDIFLFTTQAEVAVEVLGRKMVRQMGCIEGQPEQPGLILIADPSKRVVDVLGGGVVLDLLAHAVHDLVVAKIALERSGEHALVVLPAQQIGAVESTVLVADQVPLSDIGERSFLVRVGL